MERKWYHGNVNAKTASKYKTGEVRIEDQGFFIYEGKPVFQFTLDLEASPLGQICKSRTCGYIIPNFADVEKLLKRAGLTHSSELEGKLVNIYVNKEGKIEGIGL